MHSSQSQVNKPNRKPKIPVVKDIFFDENSSVHESIAIAKDFLCNYGPRWGHNYETACENPVYNLHPQNVPRKNPLVWDVAETYDYLSSFKSLRRLASLLRGEDIDGAALLAMRKTDFTDLLKVSQEIADKVYAIIIKLRCHIFKNFRHTLFL